MAFPAEDANAYEMQTPAVNRLTVPAVLLAMVAGIIGVVAGATLGIALGTGLASLMHVPTREGGAGYSALIIAFPVMLLGGAGAMIWLLRHKGVRGVRVLGGVVAATLGIVMLCAAAFGVWYALQPHILNANGATPILEYEIRPAPAGSAETLAKAEVELQTDRNTMPGNWRSGSDVPEMRAGFVEVYFRTSQRMLVLKLPDHKALLYRLRLPANPMGSRNWTAWLPPDFVDDGKEQTPKAPTGGEFQIRYRMEPQ